MGKNVVGFISEKGGVGKTAACYHIAIALSRYHDKKVLVVDADYQPAIPVLSPTAFFKS